MNDDAYARPDLSRLVIHDDIFPGTLLKHTAGGNLPTLTSSGVFSRPPGSSPCRQGHARVTADL